LDDNRPRFTTDKGSPIRLKFLKYHLEGRLREYLALGGVKELIERTSLEDRDLWAYIETVRIRYNFYAADYHFDPEGSDNKDTVDGVTSFDTK
jgi:hypothetical protein